MNLKKYTKAELISQIKGLKDNSNNPNSNLMTILLSLKTLLLKITLIALIIKVIKRFSILRRLWRIFNYSLLSVFGISLVDSYEIEFISNIIHKIMDIFSNFYDSITGLFSKKVDVPIKEFPSRSGRLNQSQPNATGINESNRIIERFTKIINNKDEIILEPVVEEENNPYYKNKYLILAALLLLSGVAWYYWDEITPAGTTILSWFRNLRSKPSSEPDGPKGSISGSPKANSVNEVVDPVDLIPEDKSTLQTLKDKIFGKFYKKDYKPLSENTSPDIELVKGSPSLKDMQNMKLDMHPTGEFINNSTRVINLVNKFNDDHESNVLISEGTPDRTLLLYNFIRGELFVLSSTYRLYYMDWIKNDSIDDSINKFIALEKQISEDARINGNIDDNQSETYNEVALATANEQDIWSDKALSSGVRSPEKVLSPLNFDNSEAITNQQAKDLLNLLSRDTNIKGPEVLPEARETIKEVFNKETTPPGHSDNSNDSIDHYFPEVQEQQEFIQGSSKDINQEVKMSDALKNADISEETRTSWMDSLKNMTSKLKKKETTPEIRVSPPKTTVEEVAEDLTDILPHIKATESSDLIKEVKASQTNDALKFSNISEEEKLSWAESLKKVKLNRLEYGSPNLSNIGLQTPVEERLKSSPLVKKASFSNQFEDTLNLFDDDPIDSDINNSNDSENNTTQNEDIETPKVEVPNFNWKEIVDYRIHRGAIQDRYIDFNFKKFDEIKNIFIILNDGTSQYFNPHQSRASEQTIKWDNLGSSNPNSKVLDVFKIYLMEKNHKDAHEIYSNNDVKILNCYIENSNRGTFK